ncbi:MAG TPA: HlyD family type I secretion periplasmic adaptor subunit [Pseudomonadales bacterium]
MNQNTNLPASSDGTQKASASVPALSGITRATEALTHTGQGVETSFDAPRRIGMTIAFLVFGVFGIWAVFAPLGESAHAVGRISVSSYNKVVQHLEGGIVKDLQVQNGDTVKAGDVLLTLDSTQSQAQLEIYSGQLLALSAKEARLIAERDNLDTIAYPELLTKSTAPQAKVEMASQDQQFRVRKAAQEGAIAVLEQRVGQLESRIQGLEAMRESKTMLANSYGEELSDVQTLLDRGFENKQRLRELERSHAVTNGEAADLAAQIASTEIQIGETKLQILQLQNEFQTQVVDELATTQTALNDTSERVTALTDIVARTFVRATADGVVTGLQFHTVGGVVAPGTEIAQIVPQAEDLIIEAQVAVTDIDRVEAGQEATIRLSAFSSKSVPTLYGTVLGLSADAMIDEATRQSYYQARVAINPESLEDLEGLELVPGMPAEVFIATGSRTFLQYLLKPLSISIARSFNED